MRLEGLQKGPRACNYKEITITRLRPLANLHEDLHAGTPSGYMAGSTAASWIGHGGRANDSVLAAVIAQDCEAHG